MMFPVKINILAVKKYNHAFVVSVCQYLLEHCRHFTKPAFIAQCEYIPYKVIVPKNMSCDTI